MSGEANDEHMIPNTSGPRHLSYVQPHELAGSFSDKSSFYQYMEEQL